MSHHSTFCHLPTDFGLFLTFRKKLRYSKAGSLWSQKRRNCSSVPSTASANSVRFMTIGILCRNRALPGMLLWCSCQKRSRNAGKRPARTSYLCARVPVRAQHHCSSPAFFERSFCNVGGHALLPATRVCLLQLLSQEQQRRDGPYNEKLRRVRNHYGRKSVEKSRHRRQRRRPLANPGVGSGR
jgi:hypothetical protein